MEFLLKSHFRDFDQLAEQARSWQLDFVQLDRGKTRFDLVQAGIGGVQLARARFGRKLHQRGAAPPGMRSIVIPTYPKLPHHWRGHEVDGNDLLIFPENGEFSSISQPGFDNVIQSVPIEALERICEEEELPGPDRLLADREFVSLAPGIMAPLRKQALAYIAALKEARDTSSFNLLRKGIAENLTRSILVTLATSLGRDPAAPSPRQRGACLRVAIELIEECGDEKLSVSELSRRARCSERTLLYAFKEHFGIGPKAYVQMWRLNQVRRKLSKPSVSVPIIADVANQCGFWHMGQFAADYRKMFGELPSETLARGR